MQAITALFLFVTIAVTVFTSSIEVFNGNLDVGALIALNILIGRSFGSIVALPDLVVFLKSGKGIPELEEMAKKAPVSTAFRKPKAFEAHASVKGLSLIYPQMRTFTFEGLNLDFLPGSTTVIKGDNGAGKTTFFNIFTGTYLQQPALFLLVA